MIYDNILYDSNLIITYNTVNWYILYCFMLHNFYHFILCVIESYGFMDFFFFFFIFIIWNTLVISYTSLASMEVFSCISFKKFISQILESWQISCFSFQLKNHKCHIIYDIKASRTEVKSPHPLHACVSVTCIYKFLNGPIL